MRLNHKKQIFAALYVLLTSGLLMTNIYAVPTVIAVAGPTYPIEPFLSGTPHLPNPIDASTLAKNIAPPATVQLLPSSISTPSMKPGDVSICAIHLPYLMQPIFIIGSDIRSKEWLTKYQARLNAFHAVGFLVQADTLDDIHTIQQLAPDLTILPMAGDAFSQALHLQHYPVLISNNVIEQ